MFYRGIATSLVDGKYIGIQGRESIAWYCVENGRFRHERNILNPYFRRDCGMTATQDRSIVITNNGFVYMNPKSGRVSKSYHFATLSISGKANCVDGLLAVSDGPAGTVTLIDVSDMEEPEVLSQFSVSGNPDIAYMDDEMILIPCRRGGLLKMDRPAQ